jgi:hypothetical protein
MEYLADSDLNRRKNNIFHMLMGWYRGYFGCDSAPGVHLILMEQCHELIDRGVSVPGTFTAVTESFIAGLDCEL